MDLAGKTVNCEARDNEPLMLPGHDHNSISSDYQDRAGFKFPSSVRIENEDRLRLHIGDCRL